MSNKRTGQEISKPSTTDPSHWLELISSGKTDLDIPSGTPNLDDALFLFSYGKVDLTKKEDLQEVWKRYARYWRQRLPPMAWELVKTRCLQRAKEDEVGELKGQMEMGQEVKRQSKG